MSSIQAYLDSIQEKTGLSIEQIRAKAAEAKLSKHAEALAWAQKELGLGHGHGSMLAKYLLVPDSFKRPDSERIEVQYQGKKAHWRPLYESLLAEALKLGPDVGTDASDTYVSFLRQGKKFAIAQPSTADRFDIGFKLKGEPTTERFEAAAKWNPMVTHRLRVGNPADVDAEALAWLAKAYAAVKL